MSKHLSAEQIEHFKDRSLSPAEMIETSDHLFTCEACRSRVQPKEQFQRAFESLRSDFQAGQSIHIQYEDLIAYLEQSPDDVNLEIMESHFESCPDCARDLEDLRGFRAEIMTGADKVYAPDTPPALRKKGFVLWSTSTSSYRSVGKLAGIAALLLLAVWIAVMPLRKQVVDLRRQVTELQQENDDLQRQASAVAELQAQIQQLQQSDIKSSPSQISDAFYDAGRLVTMDKQGNIMGLELFPTAYRQSISKAITAGQIEAPDDIRGLTKKAGILLGKQGGDSPFTLISPLGTAVESDRPTFRWNPMSGSASYIVTVFDSGFNKVASSPQLSAATWTTQRPLERGVIYNWQVTGIKDGKEILSPAPPAPEASFKVLEQAKVNELIQAKRTDPDAHLVLGILYGQYGLLDDAEREFKSLLRANPESKVARKLLNNVISLRRTS